MEVHGAMAKRKSLGKVQAVLPKRSLSRQPQSGSRTRHKQFQPPTQQLKSFRTKTLYKNFTLSTEHSTPRISTDLFNQHRFQDDHHNSQSIQELMATKNRLTMQLQTMDTKKNSLFSSTFKISETNLDQQKDLNSNLNLNNEDGSNKDQEQNDNDEDGYVMGNRADDDEKEEGVNMAAGRKKYVYDHVGNENRYALQAKAEKHMNLQFRKSECQRMNQIHEDREMWALMMQYQENKQKVKQKTKKAIDMAALAVKCRKRGEYPANQSSERIERTSSLPVIRAKPKREIMLPEIPENEEEIIRGVSKNTELVRTLPKKKQDKAFNTKINISLSYAKLGFGSKQPRFCDEETVQEEQLNQFQALKAKLRNKNIAFDPEKLKKVLVNSRRAAEYEYNQELPCKQLLSNPKFLKQPL